MIGETVALGTFILAGVLFYIWRGMNEDQPAFKFVFFALGLFFLMGAVYQLGMLAEQPVVRIQSVTTTYLYANDGNLSNTTETYTYGNYSSELEQYGNNVYVYNSVLTWFTIIVLLVVGIRIMFSAVQYHTGKKKLDHGDGTDRPY